MPHALRAPDLVLISQSDSLFEAQLIKKLVVIFALCALILIPVCCSLAVESEHDPGQSTRWFRLGELMLSATQTDGDYLLRFSKDEEELFAGACAFKTHEPTTMQSTPLAGCKTLLAYCFSGGAHCCTTLFIATECGPQASLDMVHLGHTSGKVLFTQTDDVPGKVMKVHDWQFAYYGPEDCLIQLSFANSPAMTRLLVFDKGHWRVDRVGEFSRFYSRLLDKAVREAHFSAARNEPELSASLAMKAAYYGLMSGKSFDQTAEVLNRLFPAQWKPQAGKVTQDIYRAAYEFSPVETIR